MTKTLIYFADFETRQAFDDELARLYEAALVVNPKAFWEYTKEGAVIFYPI